MQRRKASTNSSDSSIPPALRESRDHVGAGGIDESLEFVEAFLRCIVVVAFERHADEHDLFANRALDERATEGLLVRRTHQETSKVPT